MGLRFISFLILLFHKGVRRELNGSYPRIYFFFIRVSGKNPGYSLYFSVLLSKPCTMHRTTPPFYNLEFEILYLIDFFLVPLIDIDTNTLLG